MGQVMRIRYRGVPTQQQGAPFADMNITPLIDVMLVLLIMFIMVIPAAMHKTVVDMPGDRGGTRDSQVQNLSITKEGRILWNGEAISRAGLAEQLKISAAEDDTLKMQTDADARYDEFAQVISIVKRSDIKKIGFVGNNLHRDFSK